MKGFLTVLVLLVSTPIFAGEPVENKTEVSLIATVDDSPVMSEVEWNVPNLNLPKNHIQTIELEPGQYRVCVKKPKDRYYTCSQVKVQQGSGRQNVVINLKGDKSCCSYPKK